MTESANLFREVKLVTRSLLLSAPKGLSVRTFVNDYRIHNGQTFPFKELGYSSAIDLLRDLPDAVRMEWMPSVGDYMLKAIADESTKHIENLVKKQRKTKSGYPQPPRFQKLYDSSSHGRRTVNQAALKRVTNHYLSGLVPAKLRIQIRQLLASYEDGLLISNFRIAFKKHFGTDFPLVNLGFSSLENCFRHIPDIAVLKYSGSLLKVYPTKKKTDDEGRMKSASTSTTKPEKFLGTFEQPKKDTASGGFEYKSVYQNHMDALDGFDSSENVRPKYDRGKENSMSRSQCNALDTFTVKSEHEKFNGTVKSRAQDGIVKDVFMSRIQPNDLEDITSTSKIQHNINENTSDLSTQHNKLDFFNPKRECDRQDDTAISIISHDISTDDGIPEKIKRDFQRVLEFHSEGIWATEFIDKYTAITRQKLDVNELGYFSLIGLVSALPDVFIIHRPDDCKDDWLLFDAKNPNIKYIEHNNAKGAASISLTSSTCEEEPEINETLKTNVLNILKYCCKDISLEEFEKIYKANFNTDLPWASLGFDSVEAFMVVLSGDIPLDVKHINGKFCVTLQSDSPRCPMSSSMFVDLQSTTANIPNDSALSDMCFQTQPLPEDLSKYIGIYVSSIDHPGQIWIQIRGETTTVALEVLMENLEKVYYGSEGDNYRMPETYVEVGQVCAVVWPGDENWHRAVVTGIPSKDFVEVFYVDYGSRCSVKKSSLRLLKKDFLSLPAQALKARLAHILPAVGQRWSDISKQMLLVLCTDKPLAALITNTEYEGRLSICLCDVTEDNDLHINDFLIREGYAKPSKDPYGLDSNEEDAIETDTRLTLSPPVIQIQQLQQQNDVNSIALALANYQNLTGMVNIAAARLIAQLSGSGVNVDSLPQLLSSLTLGATSVRNTCSENVVVSSMTNYERSVLEEPREIFEEGDEFYEQLCQSAEELKFSIKRISLVGGQLIHIIDSNNKPFVSSGDISSLFGRCVYLEKLLMMKKILIPSITLEKSDNEELFHELKRHDVKGIKGEKGTERIILYPLQSVMEILDGLSHPSEILRKEIADIITEVNISEDFWQDNDVAKDTYLTSQSINVERTSMQELSVMYKDQCQRRNEIIQKMTESTGPKDCHVEELHCIESNLTKLNARMKEIENARGIEMKNETTILQEIQELPKIDFNQQQFSVEHNNQHELSYKESSVPPKEMHNNSSSLLERNRMSPPQGISNIPSVKQEEFPKDLQSFRNDNVTNLLHSEKSSVQYTSVDSQCNNTANDISSQVSNICTVHVASTASEQTAFKNVSITQGKISPIVPSKPSVRFSSQIFAPRTCSPAPSMFSVRPTVVQPRYTWGVGKSTL